MACWIVGGGGSNQIAAGISSSITFARAGARSVMTSTGARCAASYVVKNLVAEGISLCLETYTSITWPCWSTARNTYRQMPATLT